MSVKQKTIRNLLITIQMKGSFAVLLSTAMFFIVASTFIILKNFTSKVDTQAELIGQSVLPALVFQDKETALKTLKLLEKESTFLAVALFDAEKNKIAEYKKNPELEIDHVVGFYFHDLLLKPVK